MVSIDCGFAETCAKTWKLKCKYFPSKIGGKPSFLALSRLPSANDLECVICHQTMRFLLQIYAPLSDTHSNSCHAFHRSLFVFCCFNNACNQFKVFRSQLPRKNDYYSQEPPNYKYDDKRTDVTPEQFGHHLCVVCGCDATKNCSQCRTAYYCSKQHQSIDWKRANHKINCGKPSDEIMPNEKNLLSSAIFPEYELIIRSDSVDDNDNGSDDDSSDDSSDDKKIADELRKLNDYVQKNRPQCQNERFDEAYEQTLTEDQIAFNKFKRNSGLEVIRYYSYESEKSDERVEPLWISSRNRPNLPIPNCEHCGGERRLEFQVMPQLLSKILKSESEHDLDWGTLVVYTCKQSCVENSDVAYKSEFIWKQCLD